MDLCKLFPRVDAEDARHKHGTRINATRHDKQVVDRSEHTHLQVIDRSVLGLPKVYNCFPSNVVGEISVTGFQSALTKLARSLCECGVTEWSTRFSPGAL